MNQTTLGKTGRTVSRLGLGTAFMAAQGQAGVNESIARAVDRGVSYFDTAADYGDDEEMLGIALEGRRDRVFLATKVGGVEKSGGHRRVDDLMAQFERGLSRLRTDHVDLIQLHECDQRKWWSDDFVPHEDEISHGGPLIRHEESYDFAGAPCVEFLHRAKSEGKAKHIGITGKDARRLAHICDAVEIDSLMVAHQYNPIMRSAAEYLLPLTSEQNVGVAGGAMFIKGWLARAQTDWRENRPAWMDQDFYDAYFGYLDIQAKSGIPLPELTLRWLQGEDRIHVDVIGFRNWSEIEANIESVERGPLPSDLQAEIDDLGIIQPLYYQNRTHL